MENSASSFSTENKTKTAMGQFLRFVLVGIMNTLVDLIVLNIETIITGVKEGSGYAVQKGVSFLMAVIFSYFLNKNWTFKDKSQEGETKKFSQFFLVSIIGMVINVSVATVTVTYLKVPITNMLGISFLQNDQIWVSLGALAGTAIGLIWNFLGYKFVVFKK